MKGLVWSEAGDGHQLSRELAQRQRCIDRDRCLAGVLVARDVPLARLSLLALVAAEWFLRCLNQLIRKCTLNLFQVVWESTIKTTHFQGLQILKSLVNCKGVAKIIFIKFQRVLKCKISLYWRDLSWYMYIRKWFD